MMLSIGVLGYGTIGQAFVKKFKELDYYKVDGRKTVCIHTIHVRDNHARKYNNLKHVYEKQPEGIFCCIKDGTEGTNKETPLDDDLPWFEQTSGHDITIDLTSSNDESKDLVMQQISKGYWVFLVNKELVKNSWIEIIEAAKKSGAKLSFNAIAAGTGKYSDMNLNEEIFPWFAQDPDLYSARGTTDEVVDILISELDKEFKERVAKDEPWYNMTEEQQAQQKEQEHERYLKNLESRPVAPPKYSKNSVNSDVCGINDTVDWDKYKS